MKSTSKKEDINVKKKYVFFSDPDIIVQRAETSAAAAQLKQDTEYHQQQSCTTKQVSKDKPSNLPAECDLKDVQNILLYHPIQPYPFTFISAVKRKHALDDGAEACRKTHESANKNVPECVTLSKSDGIQSLHETVQKMDYVRPLKVPDLKISAKKLDFSNRENCTTKEIVSPNFEAPSKELGQERLDKPSKSFERVQRRLDFSASDVSSTINSEIEPLKVPNISISSNLSKKKEYVRENSREKENRSKKIRKDDSLFSKQDDAKQDLFKRSRSPRHVSRKDFSNTINENASTAKVKKDRLPLHMPRESDFGTSKTKTKNFATSTVKKVTDKRHRSTNTRSLKSRDTSLESKNRSYSNESLSERSSKISDQGTIREARNMYENFDYRYKDDLHMLKQGDDQKHILRNKMTCQPQGKLSGIPFKEPSQRSDKVKPLTSKVDNKMYIMNLKESEDVESVTDSNMSVRTQSPTVSTQQTKSKDSDKAVQNINVNKINKTTEDSKYTDDSLTQCTSSNMKKEEESSAHSITAAAKQTSNSNESNLNDSALSDALLDPRRISFRDENRLQQEEFCDLITPDMNLMLRSKRKRQFVQNINIEAEPKCSKHNISKIEIEQEGIPLLHPTALHMQFQAELHLLDSFNESLRQVMDVEKCLYNVKQDPEKELPLQHSQSNEQIKSYFSKPTDERNIDDEEHSNEINKLHKHITTDKIFPSHAMHHTTSQTMINEFENVNKISKPTVKAVEVQTQTVNDIATQTELRSTRRNVQSRCSEICGTPYEREFVGGSEVPHLSLDSVVQFEDLDQIEEISLPSKLRTMSEISLHETTSSIRTETGTEISISTRDVTCSFNKYLDLEIAQLIQDEKQRYDKIEMLFKSREKTLNDRTKKLVKLEEQKRALKDTGQDSRVSSVKKKQRALLLKLQQEKDEMNRLKELHKIASQERKLMLQKQRNMFNPQMSTKNILTKLKRSADSQSPRRLSGPMKGYDIRSNSSMSSLVDSDKSQHDRSQADARMHMTETELHFSKMDLPKSNKFTNFAEDPNASFFDKSNEAMQSNVSLEKCPYKTQKDGSKSKYEIKSRKFEDKMPRADVIRLKSHQHSIDPKLMSSHSMSIPGKYLFEKDKSLDVSELLQQNLNKSISEHVKSESDTLVEELSKKSKPSQIADNNFQNIVSPRESLKSAVMSSEIVPEEISSVSQETVSKTSKSSQVSEDILQTHSKSSKRNSKSIPTDMSKKTQYTSESKSNFKRKNSKCQKSRSSSSILTENILRSKSNSQISEELIKHHNKRTKMEKEFIQSDRNDENALLEKRSKDKNLKLLSDRIDDYDSKESELCQQMFEKNVEAYDENSIRSQDKDEHNFDNASTKSQISNFAVSHHSSGESERNYSKSVVIRLQEHNLKTSKKLQQILNAREAALTSRKNCVEEWMAWHAKVRTEEDRVARMEQAALKLVTATSNVFSQQDTTVSSDTSDIEGRIELLTEKLAERRIEMSRLKREARKETKQKLRALEANLLNQIKKYDTTIYEMRKKLESKKGVSKGNDKLAIESRSLADFKVPEIPLKKIQEIFKNSDLLRSRSESDLLSSRRLPVKDPAKNLNILRNEIDDGDYKKSYSELLVKSSRSVRTPEQLSLARLSTVNRSAQSVFDECMLEQIEIDKIGSASMSSVSDDIRSEKNICYDTRQYANERHSKQSMSDGKKNSISEDVRTEISNEKSETDIQTEDKLSKNETSIQSDLKEYKSDFETFSEQSRLRTVSSQSGANRAQGIERSHISSKGSNNVQSSAVQINTEAANGTLDFSKKLDFLHLNNQNLNEDISSLENELKILSEMMSRFNKKPNEKNKQALAHDEKSTSKDISEILSKSNKSEEISDVESAEENKNKDVELDLKEINSDISQHLPDSTKLRSFTNFNDSQNIVEKVSNVISAIIPQNEQSSSKSISQEIDYKARSKEILNEVEKSISERIKINENNLSRSEIVTEDTNINSCEGNRNASNNTPAEINIRSISDIYSKAIQGKQSRGIVGSQVTYSAEENVDVLIEEDVINVERNRSLESNSNSTITSEISNLLEKDKSSNQYTDINHSSINNDVLTAPTRSENKSDATPKQFLQNLSKDVSVAEYMNELLKKQISPQSSSSLKPIESCKGLTTDYAKETSSIHKYQNISDTKSISKIEDLELPSAKSKEVNDGSKNKCSLREIEDGESKGISRKSIEGSKHAAVDQSISIDKKNVSKDETQSQEVFMDETSFDKDDWTVSDSFDVPHDVVNSEWDKSENQDLEVFNDNKIIVLDLKDTSRATDDIKNQIFERNEISEVEESLFIPKCESTNINMHETKLDETETKFYIQEIDDNAEYLLDIIAKDNDKEQSEEETVHSIESDDFQKAIYESVTKILDKVEKSIEDSTIREKIESHSSIVENKALIKPTADEGRISISSVFNVQDKTLEESEAQLRESNEETTSPQNVSGEDVNEDIINKLHIESIIDVAIQMEINNDADMFHGKTKSQEIIVTEIEQGSVVDENLLELEVAAEIELADDVPSEINKFDYEIETQEKEIGGGKLLEPIIEQDSSDGEQLDNLVEVTESGLDIIEKPDKSSIDSITEAESISCDKTDIQAIQVEESEVESQENAIAPLNVDEIKTVKSLELAAANVSLNIANKTFDILRDPEYEDISEESLEVSEIFDKGERQKPAAVQKSSILERYEAIQESNDVLKILDVITQKSLTSVKSDADKFQDNKYVSEDNENRQIEICNKDSVIPSDDDNKVVEDVYKKNEQPLPDTLEDQKSKTVTAEIEDQSTVSRSEIEGKENQEQDALSESSEDRDTPKGVLEIEMDSPRDLNDSRLNIDGLNDDLLHDSNAENQNTDSNNTFHAVPIVATSEKDIEVMIDKLKASLEQPGVEVADWEAKLLRIEQLQIELEIKKLEAEEVSYYVREIPNKPPPPYTPPGGGARISTCLGSPSPPPAVIPSNIEELTAFTEKATAIIFKTKQSGEDISCLEAPPEIYELTKENDEILKKDRRIYNTFLFDLCKETIAEVYQAEYEKPGPSWTKPSVKTKPLMKVPKTIDELNAYVNKEIATLFGFKTKLQRENMVMRWSRKRRDRVDELLAREAQAEEAEWTKFHHDELAVKNGLTVTILDTLLMETVNIVKVAYAKKRKVMV